MLVSLRMNELITSDHNTEFHSLVFDLVSKRVKAADNVLAKLIASISQAKMYKTNYQKTAGQIVYVFCYIHCIIIS